MNRNLLGYLVALANFLVLDALWLSTMTSRFYRPQLESLLAPNPNFVPAIIFYLLYPIGLLLLVVQPAFLNKQKLFKTFLMGALFGFIGYGTYDLTNHATLKDWPWIVTVVDICWGMWLSGTVALLTTVVLRNSKRP